MGLPLNCKYNGPAKPLSVEGQKILAKRCPHLLVDDGNGTKTCCDENQLKTFDNSLKLAENLIKRCPSCLRNLARHLCDMTCAPDHSKFVNVTNESKCTIINIFKYITFNVL